MSIRPTTVQHTLRQLKLAVPGGAITYYLGTCHEFWRITQVAGSWGQSAAYGALGLGLTTIALFFYVLLTPWIKGVEPNYRSWRESGVLSSVIPLLTTTIVVGSLLLAVTLGQWSNLGYLKGVVAAAAIYVLAFGLLGLVPVPKAPAARPPNPKARHD
ncbi:hypothetical protein LshimejAT787_0803200 [Lyophyllum shimeji]|uniref:Uncharacterized protein n=1 Tax=Lyophyllum shimeji TaxID=47721 RepID=A0A9P3UMH8_LYOSH|nr:hypothetical protein LshimejAT787_0803200 [Lyophyllum shimeji]